MMVSPREYLGMAPLPPMPMRLPNGFKITRLELQCCSCGAELAEVRYETRKLEGCIEVVCCGVCRTHNSLVTCRFRSYSSGRVLDFTDKGWEERRSAPSLWDAVIGKVRVVLDIMFPWMLKRANRKARRR